MLTGSRDGTAKLWDISAFTAYDQGELTTQQVLFMLLLSTKRKPVNIRDLAQELPFVNNDVHATKKELKKVLHSFKKKPLNKSMYRAVVDTFAITARYRRRQSK